MRVMFEQEKRLPIPSTLYHPQAVRVKLMNIISAKWWHKWCDFCQFEDTEAVPERLIATPDMPRSRSRFARSTRNASRQTVDS